MAPAKQPIPSRYSARRQCPVAGCGKEMEPREFARLPTPGPPLGVQFECTAGHRLVRRVAELWEILHEDPREAYKENTARVFGEMAGQVTGDVRTMVEALARRIRATAVDDFAKMNRVEAIMAETGWSKEKVEYLMGEIPGPVRVVVPRSWVKKGTKRTGPR